MDCFSALNLRFYSAQLLNSRSSDNVAALETEVIRLKQLPFPQNSTCLFS